jgi:hypothetical protein
MPSLLIQVWRRAKPKPMDHDPNGDKGGASRCAGGALARRDARFSAFARTAKQ